MVASHALRRQSFQSTPSGGKATGTGKTSMTISKVSIHAFRGEGDAPWRAKDGSFMLFQSTPSGGKATPRRARPIAVAEFQSTPSGGKATELERRINEERRFQSTPSGGKATSSNTTNRSANTSFNPRLPGGRRPLPVAAMMGGMGFNPRLPGGRRHRGRTYFGPLSEFQSTPSGGKAT